MTVYEPTTIDNVSIDARRRQIVLGLVVPGPISSDAEFLTTLGKTLNAYAGFVASGQLARHYPAAAGLAPVIEVAHSGRLDEGGLRIVEGVAQQLVAIGISLRTVDLDVAGGAIGRGRP